MANIISKHIPNTLTCCNLISGCVATYFALNASFKYAFVFIIIGAIFDFFDGMSARMLKVSSPIGKELDSLADVITFGFAPSAMIFTELNVLLALSNNQNTITSNPFVVLILPFVAFILAAFSALRLAKFNLDERQTTSFIGLPTPANALFWASLLVSQSSLLENTNYSVALLVIFIFVFSWLLVSEIPMFALKFKNYSLASNKLQYSFVLLSVIIFVLTGILSGFWIVIFLYLAISVARCLINKQ